MNPIKAVEVQIVSGGKPSADRPGFSWFLIGARFIDGDGTVESTWALVPDEAPSSSPTEADIVRRVELLQEACVVSLPPIAATAGCAGLARDVSLSGVSATYWQLYDGKWVYSTASDHNRAIRAAAIRELLAERGAK
jgi:hypothetical protein